MCSGEVTPKEKYIVETLLLKVSKREEWTELLIMHWCDNEDAHLFVTLFKTSREIN